MRTAIEQDVKVLLSMRTFNFDINNIAFVRYFEGRTGHSITTCQCGWAEVVKLITNPPDDVWRITRAKLQDCWDLFTQPKVIIHRLPPAQYLFNMAPCQTTT